MRPRQIQHLQAFTLVEVIVAMTIIGVLIVLALPTLLLARQRSVEAKCLSHLRSAFLAAEEYATDYAGKLPFGGDVPHPAQGLELRREFMVGGPGGLSGGKWSLLFPGYWQGDWWSPAMMCPRQSRFDPAVPGNAVPRQDGSFMLPTVWMSQACWLDPASLRAGLPEGAIRPKPNSASDVLFPSAKVLFFEQIAWCAHGADAEFWKRTLGQTHSFESSAGTFDGSVRRMRRIDGLPAERSMPFDATIDGIRGRDLR